MVAIIALAYFRAYDGTMRMVSTNSRVISAACHVLKDDERDGHLLPIKWGVVQRESGVGKVAFTTAPDHETRLPQVGKLYI